MAAKKKRRKAGRPKGSKNKKTSRKKSRKKTSKKKSRKKTAKKRRSGKVPTEVIKMRAKSLKKNKRAAAIYRDVLGC